MCLKKWDKDFGEFVSLPENTISDTVVQMIQVLWYLLLVIEIYVENATLTKIIAKSKFVLGTGERPVVAGEHLCLKSNLDTTK